MNDAPENIGMQKTTRWRNIVLLIVITSLVGVYSLATKRQLEFMGGLAEDNFMLGWELAETGRFYPDRDVPYVLRDPGYPFFIACVLKASGTSPPPVFFADQAYMEEQFRAAFRVVYAFQLVLLVISTVILYLWLASRVAPGNALAVSLAFGICPYMQILTGLLHYSMLHLCFTMIAMIVMQLYFEDPERLGNKTLFASGVLWGIVTLIRPMTLILPVFVLAALWLNGRPGWKRLTARTALFTIGLILVVGPYIYRNYFLTGRFIAVSAQGAQAFGASGAEKIRHSPNHYIYWDVWVRHGLPLYQELTGTFIHDYDDLIRHNVELEKRFLDHIINELTSRRFFYYAGNWFYNLFEKAKAYLFLINSVFIKVFQVIQDPSAEVEKAWFVAGHPQDFYSDRASHAFELYIFFLSCCGAAGVAGAVRRKDRFIIAALATYACLGLAHILLVFGLMHYYIKIPFVFMFYGYSLSLLENRRVTVPILKYDMSQAAVLNMIVFLWGLAVAVYVMKP